MMCQRCANPSPDSPCLTCREALERHAAYMRAWRRTHPMTPYQRLADRARSYAGVLKARGRLVPKPCGCGATATVMHLPSFARPEDVVWMCRMCLGNHMEKVFKLSHVKQSRAG